MNDEKFLDEALKEHARHEGNADQEFLDQLEAKLDDQENAPVRTSKKSQSKVGWMSAAALVLIGITAGALFWKPNSDQSNIAYSPKSEVLHFEQVFKEAPTVPEESKIRINHPTAPVPVLTKPENSLASAPITLPAIETPKASSVLFRESDSFGSGWGDGTKASNFGRGRQVEVPSGNRYGTLIEQGFLSPLKAPLSTFSTDVDTASYTNIRKLIGTGQKIDPNAVRIEEMINYFSYQYEQSLGDHPFAVHPEVASCPWNPAHRLVRIGIKGKEIQAEARKASNLVFLIDVSGSMNSPDKLPLLVQSFEVLLSQLNENDRVSLVVYAGRQAVLLNPTAIDQDGRAAVGQALKKLSAGGSTNGAAGISTAYDLARKGFIEGGVNRVILATDGDFNVGTTNQEELLKLVKNQAEGQISLTILGFGQGNLNDALMEELTNRGDGNYFYLDSLREGQKVFQNGLTGTLQTIAKDVKIQVEFNPGKVSQYRLIGYANRRLKDEDFANDKIDAGDIGAGHTVTALYEIIPAGAETTALPGDLKYQKSEAPESTRKIVESPELLTVKLRYKQPDGDTSTELSQTLTDENRNWPQASDDFRFASSVALWGMLLRNSEHAGEGSPEMVTELALGARGNDPKGERAGHLDLLRNWTNKR
ncbi:VWA domain-containing protein [Verrucomicrobiaceae bacterium 227]